MRRMYKCNREQSCFRLLCLFSKDLGNSRKRKTA